RHSQVPADPAERRRPVREGDQATSYRRIDRRLVKVLIGRRPLRPHQHWSLIEMLLPSTATQMSSFLSPESLPLAMLIDADQARQRHTAVASRPSSSVNVQTERKGNGQS